MELVEGEDIAERLKRGPIPLEEALEVARQVAEALEEAHEHGIVHRSLLECLQQKLAEDPGYGDSFSTFFEQRVKPTRGLAFKRNAAIDAAWNTAREATLARFRDGVHRGYTRRPYGTVAERPW